MSIVGVDLGLLIELVASHPHLYDMKNKQYKENDTKDNTWNEISIVLETTVEDCKRLWKNLRDRFSKEKRILKSGDSQRESEWPYFRKMAFYDRYCTPRKTVTATRPVHKIMESESEASVGSPRFSEDEDRSASEILPSCSDQQNSIRVLPQKCLEETLVDKSKVLKKRKRDIHQSSELTEIANVAKEISSQITKPRSTNTTNESFGQYVHNRLDQMTEGEAKMARQQIVQILER